MFQSTNQKSIISAVDITCKHHTISVDFRVIHHRWFLVWANHHISLTRTFTALNEGMISRFPWYIHRTTPGLGRTGVGRYIFSPAWWIHHHNASPVTSGDAPHLQTPASSHLTLPWPAVQCLAAMPGCQGKNQVRSKCAWFFRAANFPESKSMNLEILLTSKSSPDFPSWYFNIFQPPNRTSFHVCHHWCPLSLPSKVATRLATKPGQLPTKQVTSRESPLKIRVSDGKLFGSGVLGFCSVGFSGNVRFASLTTVFWNVKWISDVFARRSLWLGMSFPGWAWHIWIYSMS